MKKVLSISAGLLALFLYSASYAGTCSQENDEQRLLEKVTPNDHLVVIQDDQLDLFIKNANDLYNIGWVRDQLSRIDVVEAEIKADNPKFQVMWLFFIDKNGCIQYYQNVYKAVLDLMLDQKPCEKLGIACQ